MAPSSCSPLVTHPQSDNRADGEEKMAREGREIEDKREEKIWAGEEGDKGDRKTSSREQKKKSEIERGRE